jgi:WG repeat protein
MVTNILKPAILFALSAALYASLAYAADSVEIPRSIPKGGDQLFRFSMDHKTGFMDQSGAIVVQPTSMPIGSFFEGRAAFESNDKYGFLDTDGNQVISANYDAVGIFSEGLASVRLGKLWGYIDKSGQVVIKPAFRAAGPMRHGLARVATWDGFDCFDDRKHLSNEAASNERFNFPDQLDYNGCVLSKPQFGFVNANGKVIIPLQYSYAADFSEGYARVGMSKTGDLFGFINEAGILMVPPTYIAANDFSEGLAAVKLNSSSGWSYINSKGVVVIDRKLQSAHAFAEGVAAACEADNRCGYVNSTGEFVIAPRFAEAEDFSEGLALVADEEDGAKHFIDHSGKSALSVKSKKMSPFSGSLSLVEQNGKMVYVSKKGKVVRSLE